MSEKKAGEALLGDLSKGEKKTARVLKEKYNFSNAEINKHILLNRAAAKDKAIEDEEWEDYEEYPVTTSTDEIPEADEWLDCIGKER